MSWDWALLLVLDAGILVIATFAVIVLWLRDLHRQARPRDLGE